MWLYKARVLTHDFHFHEMNVNIEQGKIISLSNGNGRNQENGIELTGFMILPGLIDMHVHGYLGYNVMTAQGNEMDKLSLLLAQNGITSFVPTTTTVEKNQILSALRRIRKLAESGMSGACIRAIYMEGPFISQTYTGALLGGGIINPNMGVLNEFLNAGGDWIKLIAIAPEKKDAESLIRACVKNNIIVTIAHTAATYMDTVKAIKTGASHITHLFNAMSGLHHREPGVIGAAWETSVTVELICDGYHISPTVIKMAYRLFGSKRIILISDNTQISGMEDGIYEMDGQISIVNNHICRLLNGPINGNMHSLMYCVKQAVSFGIPLELAVKMATLNPAKVLGIDSFTGSLEVGKDADLVVVDKNFNVYMTMVKGNIVYQKHWDYKNQL